MSAPNAGINIGAESAAANDPHRGSIQSELGYGDVETSDESEHPVAPDQFDPKFEVSTAQPESIHPATDDRVVQQMGGLVVLSVLRWQQRPDSVQLCTNHLPGLIVYRSR